MRLEVISDLVHVHRGEDMAMLPLAALAARRHGCLLVAAVHLSICPVLPVVLPGADAVIVLTPSAAQYDDGIPPEPAPALTARGVTGEFSHELAAAVK